MNDCRVIISGWFTVEPEKRDAVVESFKYLIQRARSFPGCLDLAITADPIDPGRINNFEFWQSEDALNEWRAVSNPPKEIAPMLQVEVQKHIVQRSGPPF